MFKVGGFMDLRSHGTTDLWIGRRRLKAHSSKTLQKKQSNNVGHTKNRVIEVFKYDSVKDVFFQKYALRKSIKL